VNIFNAIYTVGSVSEVTEPEFTGKSDIFLKPGFVFELIFALFLGFFILFSDFFKEVGDGLGFDRTVAANVSMARINVNLDVCDSSAILTAIVLFFHQDVHLVHGVHGPIFFDVVRKWFS
jgi:hypothetical protein